MRLKSLLTGISTSGPANTPDPEIKGLACDSRKVRPGFLFIALKGTLQDGHDFIEDAVRNGASAVVGESFTGTVPVAENIPTFQVPDSRVALAQLALNFYGQPFRNMKLIGITGTNGKTTTSYLLESILFAAGSRPGVIGTISYRAPGITWPAPVTTPDSLELIRILRSMADTGVSDVVMEVSSHALDQKRITGCPFRTAVFTNLSRDHLDYHGSMSAYFEAKSRLFRELRSDGDRNDTKAVINADDPSAGKLARLTPVPVVTYGLERDCNVRAEQVVSGKSGVTARLIAPGGRTEVRSSLIGGFNIYNILAAAAAALCLGISLETIAHGVSRLQGVPGRLERVPNRRSLTIIVDYAHTPDALLKALTALRPLAGEGRLITVFGCGGDRDKGKRREMGQVAAQHSDLVILTSDNPRTEDPESIIAQIEPGMRDKDMEKLPGLPGRRSAVTGYFVEPDRAEAIQKAVEEADQKDIILIAGKGHEDYQIIGTQKRHFDDREVAAKAAS